MGSVFTGKEEQMVEVAGFLPVRIELIQLLKFWFREFLNQELCGLLTGSTGSYDRQVTIISMQRFQEIRALLPEDKGKGAVDEVIENFKKDLKFTKDDWNVFFHGTSEGRKQLWKNRKHD